jgi:hypothetical protein
MANIKVRYIGKKPVKKDTVTESLVLWYGENSVAEVPEEVAFRLFQHPDVWQPADKPVIERPVVAPAPAAGEGDDDDDDDEQGEPGDEIPAGEEGGEVDTGTEVTPEEISLILPLLDKEADFTEAGRPMVGRVRGHFEGREVTIQALKAAWENFKGSE